MINYMKAEFYRIFHKKSLYSYICILFILYNLSIFIRLSNLDVSSILNDANTLFSLLPVFLGGYLFASTYNDDLDAKTLPKVIGFGKSRIFIIITKLFITLLLIILFYLLVFIMFILLSFFIGISLDFNKIMYLLKMLLSPILLTIGFAAITSIIVFATQKSTFSIVVYLFLSTGIINQLIGMILRYEFIQNIFGDLSYYTLSTIVLRLTNSILSTNLDVLSLIQYFIFVLFAIFISIIIFNKKELEF